MVRIEVTQEDIDQGKRGDARACPIALAAQRAGVELRAYSLSYDIYRDGQRTQKVIPWPPGVTGWMDRFDRGEYVPPLTFTLYRH